MGLWEIIPAPQILGSSFSRVDDNSSVSSATSATSLPSPDSCKNSDTNCWIKSQIDILVSLWQENIRALELARSHKIWVKIKATVDNLAPAKTIRQCKDKMWNLKEPYERAKQSNKKIGAAWRFRPCFTQIDKILGCRDVTNLPEKTEVGANSISDDEINASSDSDSEVNKSNVLKQILKKVWAKGDDGNSKFIFQCDKSCPSIFNTGFSSLNV